MLKILQEYKEKHTPRECIFSFGEMLYQQTASFMIEQDLKGDIYMAFLFSFSSFSQPLVICSISQPLAVLEFEHLYMSILSRARARLDY
jgi:hypothetical protein